MLGTVQTTGSVKTSLSSVCIWWIWYSRYSKTKVFCALYFFKILCQDTRTKGETLKLTATEFERNNRKLLWLAYTVLWNCGMLHKHYFMTINNSGSYDGLMIIKSRVSECKLFSGRLSRKFSPVFTSKCCANEILNNLLMSPVKQSSLFMMFHNLKFLFQFVLQKLSLFFLPQWSALGRLRRYKTPKCCSASDRRYGRKSRSVCILWMNSQPPPSINEKSSRWLIF